MSGNTFNFIGEERDDEVPQVEFEQAVGLPPSSPPEIAQLMSEAEQRFAKASYYQSLIANHPFTEDYTTTAMEVAAEIQSFCRDRLTMLLGLKPEAARPPVPQAKPLFDEDEVKVLRSVAARLLKKPDVLTPVAPPAPVVHKVQGPTPKPAPAAAPKPLAKAQAAPAKVPAAAGAKPGKRAGAATGDTIKIPQADGSERLYRKMLDPKYGDYWMGENGQHYSLQVNEAGQNYMKSISRQARPAPGGPQPLPQLTGDMMAMVAARHVQAAMSQDEVASGRASGGRAIITAASTPQ